MSAIGVGDRVCWRAVAGRSPGEDILLASLRSGYDPATGWTGTVQKTYKNGRVLVAIDQLRNRSEDGRKSILLDVAQLERDAR